MQKVEQTQLTQQSFMNDEIKMGSDADKIFKKAAEDVIKDQLDCGIDIITDGEIKREITFIIIVDI